MARCSIVWSSVRTYGWFGCWGDTGCRGCAGWSCESWMAFCAAGGS
jgi:hypothetical protein